MKNPNIKISLPAVAVEIGELCSPRITEVEVNIHHYGGSSVSIVATGTPDYPVEIVMQKEELARVTGFLHRLVHEDKKPKQSEINSLVTTLRNIMNNERWLEMNIPYVNKLLSKYKK